MRQSLGQVPDKVADLLQTQIMKVRDTNHVADFHDLCPRQVQDFVGNLSRTLLQTSQHVEMVCVRDFRDLCPRLSLRESFSESQRNGIWAYASLMCLLLAGSEHRKRNSPFQVVTKILIYYNHIPIYHQMLQICDIRNTVVAPSQRLKLKQSN